MLRYSKLLVNAALLLTLPSIALYPQSYTPQKVNIEETQVARDYVLSYDEILQLLDQIESGELEKKCTPEQVVLHFKSSCG